MRSVRSASTLTVKHEVDVAVVLGAHDVEQAHDGVVARELLQVHDLAEGALRVRRVSERIEALLQRDDVLRAAVNGLPHDAVGLRAGAGGGRGAG